MKKVLLIVLVLPSLAWGDCWRYPSGQISCTYANSTPPAVAYRSSNPYTGQVIKNGVSTVAGAAVTYSSANAFVGSLPVANTPPGAMAAAGVAGATFLSARETYGYAQNTYRAAQQWNQYQPTYYPGPTRVVRMCSNGYRQWAC